MPMSMPYVGLLYLLFRFGFSVSIIVNTTRGPLAGITVNYGNNSNALFHGQADIFLGVPYAKPPLGTLRFQRTQNLTQFPDYPNVYNATAFAPECPQGPGQGPSHWNGSYHEDCLYLNIFAPIIANFTDLVPVMVFIHGGGHVTGGAARFPAKGIVTNFVDNGVILVTIQFRLGAAGMFTTQTDAFPGNRALGDQIEALRWVRDEIRAFGGDPKSVTLFGQSAGAMAVSAHTLMPLSRGLFSSAILQSGSILSMYEGMTGYTNLSFNIANNLCGITQADWDSGKFDNLTICMANASVEQLVQSEFTVDVTGAYFSVDDFYLTDMPDVLAKSRPNIPVMLGTMRDEYAPWLEVPGLQHYERSSFIPDLVDYLQPFVGNCTDTMIQTLYNTYITTRIPPLNDTDNVGWMRAMTEIRTGSFFTGPVGRDLQWWLDNGNPSVYIYEFTFETDIARYFAYPEWQPVVHGDGLPLLFLIDYQWEMVDLTAVENDITVSKMLGKMWTDFAKSGKPAPDWSPAAVEMPSYQYYEIDVNPKMRESYRERDRLIWNNVLPALIGDLPKPLPSIVPERVDPETSGPPETNAVGRLKTISIDFMVLLFIFMYS